MVTFLAVQQRTPDAGQLITPESMMRLRIVLHSPGTPHRLRPYVRIIFDDNFRSTSAAGLYECEQLQQFTSFY